ncbi:unnamed protein product [Discula destructiva]
MPHNQPQEPHTRAPIPSSTLGDGASTIYPDDSVSTANARASPARAASPQQPQRTLASDVVEIHDICLAATQRYLDALRVNWDLRHGSSSTRSGVPVRRGGGERKGGGGGGGGGRWSPYARPAGARRRAHSEGDLDRMSPLEGYHHVEEQQQQQQKQQQPTLDNPIPSFTNSLLENIHHICALIWRRAQRDREDVLSAEARGCRKMNVLHECAEAIVLYNFEDGERDPIGCLERVVAAGRGIFQVLGDREGLKLMDHGDGDGDGEGESW